MNDDEFRLQLAAYLAGALAPGERRAVERHLEDCGACRTELAELGSVLPLMARVTAADLRDDTGPSPQVRTASVRRAQAARRRERRRARWVAGGGTLVGAAASAALAVALLGPGSHGQPLRLTADRGFAVTGTVQAAARPWGTQIYLDVSHLPAARSYTLVAVAADGRRWPAASWAETPARGARLLGAAPVPLARLARVVIRDDGGNELAVARPAAAP